MKIFFVMCAIIYVIYLFIGGCFVAKHYTDLVNKNMEEIYKLQ